MNQHPVKEIVTVSEMSRLVRLSRARFYQLVNEGIFPSPSRNETTKRPFFDRAQQEQCLLIRRINKGANGKVVIFYGCRLDSNSVPKRKQLPISKPRNGRVSQDPIFTEIKHGLAQLGVSHATEQSIRKALVDVYPDGHRDVESAELLMTVFRELQRQNSVDKLSG